MSSSDPLNLLLDEVRSSHSHPRATILVAHGLLELMVNELVSTNCKNSKRVLKDTRTYSHSAKCLLLNEIGVIHHNELLLLDRYRKLRNKFVHDVHFNVSAQRLRDVVDDFPIQFPDGQSMDANLVHLSLAIIGQVYGNHMELLNERFEAYTS